MCIAQPIYIFLNNFKISLTTNNILVFERLQKQFINNIQVHRASYL
uniref:Uncharacterized protein n=1 Tax=viral metagenome TaxID=1070528 RepID=A0A6C0D6H9_9ZZZZ